MPSSLYFNSNSVYNHFREKIGEKNVMEENDHMYRKCNEICAAACQSIRCLLNDLNENVNQLIAPENLSDTQDDKARLYENMKKLSEVDTIIREFQSEVNRAFTNTEIETERIIMDSKDAM